MKSKQEKYKEEQRQIIALEDDICPICGETVPFNELMDFEYSGDYSYGPHEVFKRCEKCMSVFRVRFTVAMIPEINIEEVEHITSKKKIIELYGEEG